MIRSGAGVAVLLVATGCAYYNAMWSAERFAKQARKLEARGDVSQARVQWSSAAVKAESVLTRHPRSRWADDALVLRAEALARAGACASAEEPIARALETVSEPALRERAGLAAAECALAVERPVVAARALEDALASGDAGRRSRAEYLAGRAAEGRLAFAAAAEHFARSRERAAVGARVRALLSAGQTEAAARALVAGGDRIDAADREAALARLPGPQASATLDRILRGRLPFAEQARLLIADGDRKLAAGDSAGAIGRYTQAERVAPPVGGAGERGIARLRLLRVEAMQVTTREELQALHERVQALDEARPLRDVLSRLLTVPETPGAGFRQAELARDSIHAPRLAGRLLLALAAADPGSIFAPKALVAALPLLPEQRDSILTVLDSRYANSPYTRALHGEASTAYAVAEDSLARELGLQVALSRSATAARSSRVAPPQPGPRGPWLDAPPAPQPPARPDVRPRARGVRPTPDRPVEPERP